VDPIRVFVGGTAEHDLPTRVLEHSIRSRMANPERLELRRLWDSTIPIPVPAAPQNRGRTTFSFHRFLIPEECGFEGKAIYLDSDMIVFGDIAELFDRPFPPGVKVMSTIDTWQTAVLLIDNSIGWRVADIVAKLDAKELGYQQVMNLLFEAQMGRFARTIPACWNSQDRSDDATKLLHFTAMNLQPWLTRDHHLAKVWEAELRAALEAGSVTHDQVKESLDKHWVRPSLAAIIGQTAQYYDSDFTFPHNRVAS
jgi:hypothetical protein